MTAPFSDPKAVAEAGEAIYKDLFQKDFEQKYRGKFVAINIGMKTATLGDSASDALLEARKADPTGVFHLIRVGFTGAFQLSRYQRATAQNCLIK